MVVGDFSLTKQIGGNVHKKQRFGVAHQVFDIIPEGNGIFCLWRMGDQQLHVTEYQEVKVQHSHSNCNSENPNAI